MALQTTLRKTITCEGIGLHSGAAVHMTLKPSAADAGIVFRRADASRKAALIPACHDLVCDTQLGTTLKNAYGVSVSTVEHLMAALWGMGVDNAVIEIDAPEVPIMDGSSEPFVELIAAAGVKKQESPRKILRVLKEMEVRDGESVARVAPFEGKEFACSLEVEIDFAHDAIGRSRVAYDFSQVTFNEMLSAARTFGFAHEVEALRKRGLAQGGSLANAIVLGEAGVMNAEGLRYPDEFARHKALDALGDLYLAGHRIEGAFSFKRPGHRVNNMLLHALLADKSAWKLVAARTKQPQTAESFIQAYI